MRSYVRLFLLFFWFASIIAPSAICLMDSENDIVLNALGEEEQKEQEEKKDPTEEKIVCDFADFPLVAYSSKSCKSDFLSTDYGDYTKKIHLPPPEHIG